jgi:hypothetical protein
MTEIMVMQGRELRAEDIGMIRFLLAEHGDWCRTRISKELSRLWDRRNEQGRIKDVAARTLLLKLERAGIVQLPKLRHPSPSAFCNRNPPLVAQATKANPLRVARSKAFESEHRRARIGRPAVIQLPVEPLSLSRPSQHGRREHEVSGARP